MELDDLYQSIIMDHGRHPRHFGEMEDSTHQREAYNPLCGDHFFIYLKVESGRIVEASFNGSGCAISTASASLLMQSVISKTIDEFDQLFKVFQKLVVEGASLDGHEKTLLGKLEALGGVKRFPMRVKCATLAWHGCQGALKEVKE